MMILRDHIHLDTIIGPAPELAPISQWRVTERKVIPRIFASVEYSVTGHLVTSVYTVSGSPLRLVDYEYIVAIKPDVSYTVEDQLTKLWNMLGKKVYLCDSLHPENGTPHTNYVKPVFFAESTEPEMISPQNVRYYVKIKLLDASRSV